MKIWFTITGTNHYFGDSFLEKGMKVRLVKEPDNRHDREAIKVLLDGMGHIGYVANSPWTVIGESYSAGRLYDKIGDTAAGKVKLITDKGILCTLKKDKPHDPPQLEKKCSPEEGDSPEEDASPEESASPKEGRTPEKIDFPEED